MSGGAPRVVAESDRRQPGGWWTLSQGSGWLSEFAQGVGDLGGRGSVGRSWMGHRGSARKCAPCRFDALCQVVSVIGRLLQCARTRYDAFAAGAPPGSPGWRQTTDLTMPFSTGGTPVRAELAASPRVVSRFIGLQGAIRRCRPVGRAGVRQLVAPQADGLDGGDTVGTATPPGRGDGELW